MKEKMRKSYSIVKNTYKSKFTDETLKRLYPTPKARDTNSSISTRASIAEIPLNKFVEKLITQYYIINKKYTNQENDLYEWWGNLTDQEKDKKGLFWDKGENNLYAELIGFFSEDAVLDRLYDLFQNICGYRTYDTRPIHDYWVSIKLQEKYIKGLNKFDDGELYLLLDEKRKQKKEEAEEKLNEEIKKKEKEDIIKNKPKTEIYNRLMKKINSLALAKDKWQTGRIMLNLKNKFSYDKIIEKMITQEFNENKEFRYPEQYAIFDSEHERKVVFKNSIEKNIKKPENINKIKEMIQKSKFADDDLKKTQAFVLNQIRKENLEIEKSIKKHCVIYCKKMKERILHNKRFLKDQFLNDLYQYLLKNYKNGCKRLFPKISYGARKKSRFNNYPLSLKIYFFSIYRTMNINKNGKFVFAYKDNLSFWAPTIKNECKIHTGGCPLYCTNNTFNNQITIQKNKSTEIFFNPNKPLDDVDRLNLWKRKDFIEEKKKIFLCLSEAEHCTFEPITNKTNNFLSNEEIINKKISNKEWVDNMGHNFNNSYPLVYKEGSFKKARIAFLEGNYTETMKRLNLAFDTDSIKAHFDPKFAVVFKKKVEEENKKANNKQKEMTSMYDIDNNPKKNVQADDYKNGKNKELCYQIFLMLNEIEGYKRNNEREAKKIEKELQILNGNKISVGKEKDHENELNKNNENVINPFDNKGNLILENKDVNNVNENMNHSLTGTMNKQNSTTNYQTVQKENFLKDRYFKFFKTIMCPLK